VDPAQADAGIDAGDASSRDTDLHIDVGDAGSGETDPNIADVDVGGGETDPNIEKPMSTSVFVCGTSKKPILDITKVTTCAH
jgi:hypothetical protein